jgi:hypothetical protein
LELELRAVAAPAGASAGATVYVLLPSLAELLARPGFGERAPIVLPDAPRPFDPFVFFGNAERRPALLLDVVLH